MKFFKILSIVLLTIIALFFVIGVFLPTTGSFEKSYTIDAPANIVENEIVNLYQNHLWPIWNSEDTSVVYTLLENEMGYTWEGTLVGAGKCEYHLGTDLSIHDQITFQGQEIANTTWQIIPGKETTLQITFEVLAGKNISARWTNLFLDKLMGDEISFIVNGIKTKLEATDL
jgi:hypothetical protein